jgi:hypothetical protein
MVDCADDCVGLMDLLECLWLMADDQHDVDVHASANLKLGRIKSSLHQIHNLHNLHVLLRHKQTQVTRG